MFRKLIKFSYQRTSLQALGWYLSFLLFGALLSGVAAQIFTPAATSFSEGFQNGVPFGRWFGVVYVMLLATALLWSRRKSALSLLLALASALLVLLIGSLAGLIPLAMLTTRPPREESSRDVAGVFE